MYPIPLLSTAITVHPLFGDSLRGQPHVFDFSSENPVTLCDTTDFTALQSAVSNVLALNRASWGIGKYLEPRPTLLRHYPQMIRERRIYHAGVDITASPGTPIFSPLDATVFRAGKEEGLGNYGGFVILQHVLDDETFYSFYGHLHTPHRVKEHDVIARGQLFAAIGDGSDSGGWFTHTHVQILTERAVAEKRVLQGYVAAEDLPCIDMLFPSPYPLLRIQYARYP